MQPKLRIAMLIDCYNGTFIGGGQVHLSNLIRILEQKYNCEITIFSQKNAHLLSRLFWNLWVVPKVWANHRKKNFHLIHAQAFTAGISGKILSLILHIPVIYSVHGCHTMDMVKNGFENKSIKYYLERFLLTQIKYDKQISVAANFLNYPNINRNIEIIENGINPIQSNKQATSRKIKDKIIMLFVGRLEKIKGLVYLIKALEKFKYNINWRLNIVGEGSQEFVLKQLTYDQNLEDKVIFLETKTGQELEKEYDRADLFILSSIAEGQPIVILEAWAHKLPVLVTKVGHNPFMVQNSKNGFLVEAGSIKAMEDGLQIAFANKNQWQKMGENGYQEVINKYTWKIAAAKTFKVYKSLI